MRIGPGRAGSSTRPRVNVSYRRTDRSYSGACAGERLVLGQGSDHRPELGPDRRARQREPERPEVSTDRLQLAQDRSRAFRIEAIWRRAAKLDEACQGRVRALGELGRLRVQNEGRER